MRLLRPILAACAAGALAAATLYTHQSADVGASVIARGSTGAAQLESAIVAALEESDPDLRVAVAGALQEAEPWTSTAAVRAHLDELRDAFEGGDLDRGSQLVVEYFQGGAAAVDQLLEVIIDPETGFADAPALAVLLKSSTYYMLNEPEHLAPWTVQDLATMGIDFLGSGDHVPLILEAGFDELGFVLEPQYLVDLIHNLEHRDVGPPLESQYPVLTLAKNWAATMGPEVEPTLVNSAADALGSDGTRAHAASMLLVRDWRRFGPELAELLNEYEAGGALEGEPNPAFRHIVCSKLADLSPFERIEYYQTIGTTPELARSMAWQMDREDAELALSQPSVQALPEFAVDLLKLRGGVEGALDAGQRLLASGSSFEMEQLVVGSWLQADLAFDDSFNSVMESRFAARSQDPQRFWGTLAGRFGELEDYQVFAGVMPWITRSEGEDNMHRRRLVAMVASRYDDIEVR